MRIAAIGDVHGCLDQLQQLLEHVKKHQPEQYIFIGDYVDRGPQIKEVVQFIIDFQKQNNVITLMGNHEDMLLQGMHDHQTDVSYQGRILPEHLIWFRELPIYHIDDQGRVYVHAGINRGLPMKHQSRSYMLWARDEFYFDNRSDGRFVVHGHTPLMLPFPDLKENRVNLDTGCVFGYVMSAAIFEDDQIQPKYLINNLGKVLDTQYKSFVEQIRAKSQQ